jgi:hypothetical protein
MGKGRVAVIMVQNFEVFRFTYPLTPTLSREGSGGFRMRAS